MGFGLKRVTHSGWSLQRKAETKLKDLSLAEAVSLLWQAGICCRGLFILPESWTNVCILEPPWWCVALFLLHVVSWSWQVRLFLFCVFPLRLFPSEVYLDRAPPFLHTCSNVIYGPANTSVCVRVSLQTMYGQQYWCTADVLQRPPWESQLQMTCMLAECWLAETWANSITKNNNPKLKTRSRDHNTTTVSPTAKNTTWGWKYGANYSLSLRLKYSHMLNISQNPHKYCLLMRTWKKQTFEVTSFNQDGKSVLPTD